MIPQKIIDEFVKRMQEAGGANIESIILFGSAVSGYFHPGLSNLNLFCVLRDASFQALRTLGPAAKWWDGQKQPPPLCMTRLELERTVDVFTIELLDMQRHHRVLFGKDVLKRAKRRAGVVSRKEGMDAGWMSPSSVGRLCEMVENP